MKLIRLWSTYGLCVFSDTFFLKYEMRTLSEMLLLFFYYAELCVLQQNSYAMYIHQSSFKHKAVTRMLDR